MKTVLEWNSQIVVVFDLLVDDEASLGIWKPLKDLEVHPLSQICQVVVAVRGACLKKNPGAVDLDVVPRYGTLRLVHQSQPGRHF